MIVGKMLERCQEIDEYRMHSDSDGLFNLPTQKDCVVYCLSKKKRITSEHDYFPLGWRAFRIFLAFLSSREHGQHEHAFTFLHEKGNKGNVRGFPSFSGKNKQSTFLGQRYDALVRLSPFPPVTPIDDVKIRGKNLLTSAEAVGTNRSDDASLFVVFRLVMMMPSRD